LLNPDHLLELAASGLDAQAGGAPRQVVLRRAVSSAYYALFHALLSATAAAFVPAAQWKARVLFYRALDHGKTRERCKRAGQDPLPKEERSFFEMQAFPPEVRRFCNEFISLQNLRNHCDYDPEFKITKEDASDAIDAASQAIADLRGADEGPRRLFLSYLLFGIRA
jgi:hypothetical protein